MAQVPVAVVGAGQAGLSLSWHLTRAGVEHVLLERHTVAHEWRTGRWDAFTLVTPNWQCRLPGQDYQGDDPDGFMGRAEVQAWVRDYAASFDAPVREGVAVSSLTEHPDRGYLLGLQTATGSEQLRAEQVVIATGGYHRPVVPAWAAALGSGVHQLHSSAYRSADELPPGGVLVVGSGQSGAQVAEDLALAGRQVHLSLGSAPRVARRYRGRDCVAWLSDMGVYDVAVAEHTGGLSKRESTNHYVTGRDGGRDLDLRALARDGMQLYGRATDCVDGRITFAPGLAASLDHADSVAESIKDDIDDWIRAQGLTAPAEDRYRPVWRPSHEPDRLEPAAAGIGSVVWAIGYRADFSWVRVGVFDGQGRPTHHRGVTRVPGLYFLGLPWLHTWGSGRFAGIARDAEHLAEHVLAHPASDGPAVRPVELAG